MPTDPWNRLSNRILIEQPGGCWIWTGYMATVGGGLAWGRGKTEFVYRLIYETLVGPIAEGMTLDHLCRTRECVNPLHLEVVTQRENTLRGVGPAAINAKKTHCPHGHEYSPANTRIKPNRKRIQRVCRTCERQARYWKRYAIRP